MKDKSTIPSALLTVAILAALFAFASAGAGVGFAFVGPPAAWQGCLAASAWSGTVAAMLAVLAVIGAKS